MLQPANDNRTLGLLNLINVAAPAPFPRALKLSNVRARLQPCRKARPPTPSFRAEQADFFFPFTSCEGSACAERNLS